METESDEMRENIILRQLLRKPRYFDPENESWVMCSWCGQEGHNQTWCTRPKRRRPCLRCGSSQHRRCRRRKAKKDQENESLYDSCLKCGGSGHDILSCSSDYSPDDLKEIQCYVCKNSGHLCCREFPDLSQSELSCYKCGESGHLGSACPKSCGVTNGSKDSTMQNGCVEQGHSVHACDVDMKDDRKGTNDLRKPPVRTID